MNYTLRDYQEKGKELLREKIRQGYSRIIFWAMTGAGKGLSMSDLANSISKNGKRVLVIMRRRELILQTKRNFEKYNDLKCSVIMGNVKHDPTNPIQICSIDTIRNRIKQDEYGFLSEFEFVIVDECHDTTSPSYDKFFEFMGDKTFIGFTATPYTIGGKPLAFWQTYVKPISAAELRDRGFLVPARVYVPNRIDTKGIKKIGGEFSAKQLFGLVSDLKIVGDIVETWKKYGDNRPTVLFAVNKAHAQLMAHAFNESGIPATFRDESHSSDERESAIQQLKNGSIKILCNVNIFSTGVDIPEIGTLIMARPTMSLVLYIQQCGRGLRTNDLYNDCIILDHAGNSIERFGLPFDEHEANIGDEKNSKKGSNDVEPRFTVKECPDCFAVLERSAKSCVYCGTTITINERDINHESGELVEYNAKQFAFERMKRRLNQLSAIGTAKGWKPNAKYFKMHKEFGDSIFKFQTELGLPKWLKSIIEKQKNEQIQGAPKSIERIKIGNPKGIRFDD